MKRETWRHKANREIGRLCSESYVQCNRKADGTYYRTHRPYSVPAIAERLIQCLNEDDELSAKRIFIYEL